MNIHDFLRGLVVPSEKDSLKGDDLKKIYWFIKDMIEEKARIESYWKTSLETLDEQSKKINEAKLQLLEFEKQSIEKDKLATIGSMSAGISHDFNNSLNILQQGIRALRTAVADNDKEMVDVILDNMVEIIRISSNLIQSIKGLQKIEDKTKIINLKVFSNTICSLYKGLTFENVFIENNIKEDLTVEIEELQLYNAMANIIKNAIEASLESSSKRIEIQAHVDGDFIYVDISDFGEGITERAKSKIFDGVSTKKDGLGFGLRNSRENLQKAGANLELVSLKNPTTFRIILRKKR